MSAPRITASANRAVTVTAGRLPRAVFAMDPAAVDSVYGPQERAALAELVDLETNIILDAENWHHNRDLVGEIDFILSGWKSPVYDDKFLSAAPRLRGVFYAAGSIRYCVTDAFWERNIPVTSAYAANAIPVAEYTVSVALLSLKQFWRRSILARQGLGWGDHTRPIAGTFRAVVGLVSFGMIARKVVELLSTYDVRILIYCPYLDEASAALAGVERVSLEELFKRSDVVSIHTPVLPETCGMIDGRLVRSMRPDGTLINTARGVILDQPSVIGALRDRPDITAILDVTDPEPPSADDPLFTLPNVVVTPHIAGSHGRECLRLGSYMVDELRRFLSGEPLRWRVTQEMARRMA